MEKTVIFKTIYAKRRSTGFSKEDLRGIFQLEVDNHIRQYPYLQYDRIDDPVKNKDGSNTFAIRFKVRELKPLTV